MELLLGVLWLAGVIWAGQRAWEHVKSEFAKYRAHVKQQGGGKLSAGHQRRHAAAWWTREVTQGFPVTRAGFHKGWLAHQTAMTQRQAQREEARTSHLEARASVLSEFTAHRRRQAEAQKLIDQATAEPPADDGDDGGVAPGWPVSAPKTDPPQSADSGQRQPTGGTPPMATATEGSYTDTVQTARSQAVLADDTAADIGAQRQAAQQILEEMEAAGVDAASISDQADLVARLLAAENALHSVTDSGESVGSGVQQRHGGLKEAVDDAPVEPAEIGWYKD